MPEIDIEKREKALRMVMERILPDFVDERDKRLLVGFAQKLAAL